MSTTLILKAALLEFTHLTLCKHNTNKIVMDSELHWQQVTNLQRAAYTFIYLWPPAKCEYTTLISI